MDPGLITFLSLATGQGIHHLSSLQVMQGRVGAEGSTECKVYVCAHKCACKHALGRKNLALSHG